MKFATASSIIVLAFSFLQLAHSLPAPAVPASTPLPSGVPNHEALVAPYRENVIF
ncbi:hypothetical protein EDB89DRAFT_2078937 [Lactarius sanguifluus]|nr:hypothetical protein EDB89DRAFT_2078937 [Lactarius sanguifluus]